MTKIFLVFLCYTHMVEIKKVVVMISKNAIQQFSQDGYYLAEGLLPPADFAPVITDCEHTLNDLCAQLRERGELEHDYADLPFAERYVRITRDTGQVFAQYFTIALPQQGLHADTPIFLAPSVFTLLTHPRLLDAVSCFLGDEIAVSPVGNVRIKPPEELIANADMRQERRGLFRATPWHQDNGVITEDADETAMITVWFPISNAPVEAGCLQLIPGSHRRELICHCPDKNGELSIPERLLPQEKTIPIPMQAGDVLFLHRRICHASLPNTSSGVRWSFDLRYIPAGAKSGRVLFPSFVARSHTNPKSVLTSHQEWAQMWRDARARLFANTPPPNSWNRWRADAVACA